jgi:putative transposase
MSRKSLNHIGFLPVHVCGRANNRERFNVPLERAWEIFQFEAHAITVIHGAEIHALVLMPNHFHLLLTVPEVGLSKVMLHWMRSVSRTMNLLSGRTGHVFGGPYHGSLVGTGAYYRHVLKYVYRNPVRASLCERVEDWSYSTLHGLLGRSRLGFPLFYPRCGHGETTLVPDAIDQLKWLNRPFPNELLERIQVGLRHREFAILADPATRRIPAENDASATQKGTA